MFDYIKKFARDDCGAITVDWVVLTAAVVGLGIGVTTTVESGIDNVADRIENALDNVIVNID